MAGLRKLRGKYYIRLWLDGKEKILPTGTTIITDAEKQLKLIQRQEIEIKQRIRKEIDEVNNRLTISKSVDYFNKTVGKERNLRPRTIKIYESGTKEFRECFQSIPSFDHLTPSHYPILLNYMQSRYNSTTVNIYLRSIRAMLNYLTEKEMIGKLPFKVKMIKVDKSLPKFITPEEMDAIYSSVTDQRLLSTFKVYEVTGMRISELIYSHRDGEFIIVERSKGHKERIVPIPAVNIIDYDTARNNPYRLSWISHSFSLACKKAGLNGKTIHCLRHTFALRKLIETNNISLVKELLGHSSVTVTEVYTKFSAEFLAQIFTDRNINQAAFDHQRAKA